MTADGLTVGPVRRSRLRGVRRRDSRTSLIVIGPVPPPYHGVTTSTALLLGSELLRANFDVVHLDTSDRRAIRTIGRWDFRNIAGALSSILRLAWRTRGRSGVVYLPLSQSV